jgi:hypothetical protein
MRATSASQAGSLPPTQAGVQTDHSAALHPEQTNERGGGMQKVISTAVLAGLVVGYTFTVFQSG